MRDRINALVKKRKAFRPFASVVAAEAPQDIRNQSRRRRYPTHNARRTHVRNEYRDKLPRPLMWTAQLAYKLFQRTETLAYAQLI